MTKNTHLQWYLKISLNEDISLRFYFVFEDRPDYTKKWFIKSHSDKKWGEISEDAVDLLLRLHNKTLDDGVEIIGRSVTNTKYRKLKFVYTENKLPQIINFEEAKDTKDTNNYIYTLSNIDNLNIPTF